MISRSSRTARSWCWRTPVSKTTQKSLSGWLFATSPRQHDPDILPNGHILVYDNLGGMVDGDRPEGRSRILEIDPMTQKIVWKYEGGPEPTDQFDSSKGG